MVVYGYNPEFSCVFGEWYEEEVRLGRAGELICFRRVTAQSVILARGRPRLHSFVASLRTNDEGTAGGTR